VPNPAQTREQRILRLVAVARDLLECGVSIHLLCDKLRHLSFRLWPTIKEKTRKEYVVVAMRAVLSQPLIDLDFQSEAVRDTSPEEAK